MIEISKAWLVVLVLCTIALVGVCIIKAILWATDCRLKRKKREDEWEEMMEDIGLIKHCMDGIGFKMYQLNHDLQMARIDIDSIKDYAKLTICRLRDVAATVNALQEGEGDERPDQQTGGD